MSLRASLKVPKYGLFYFPIDQTTSVIPLKNIERVVRGDNVTKGSKVMVKFERQVHQPEIIGVNGTYPQLISSLSSFIGYISTVHCLFNLDFHSSFLDVVTVPNNSPFP